MVTGTYMLVFYYKNIIYIPCKSLGFHMLNIIIEITQFLFEREVQFFEGYSKYIQS
jgi:hypothetical protein